MAGKGLAREKPYTARARSIGGAHNGPKQYTRTVVPKLPLVLGSRYVITAPQRAPFTGPLQWRRGSGMAGKGLAEGKTIYCLGPFYRRGTQRSQAVYAHGRPNGVAWLVGWLVLFGFGHVVHGWFLEMFRGPFGRRAPGAFVMKRAQLPPGASSS